MPDRTAADVITAEIRRHGSIPFSRYQELALYGSHGFYERGGAGRHRDFLTSPEVGPLFGAVVARRIDAVWDELRRPDPFVVVEAGAGPGTLAVAVLAAQPACAEALRYVLVDRARAQRAHHGDYLSLVPPAEAFAGSDVDDDGEHRPPTADGPLVVSLETLPRNIETGVILANELLDNLPIDLVERHGGEWSEVRVTLDDEGTLVEQLAPARADLVRAASRIEAGTATTLSGRLPIQRTALDWLSEALGRLGRGRLIVIDYARPSSELAGTASQEWLRTYRGHARGADVYTDPGTADITCDVALEQLGAIRPADLITDQASWLRSYGLDELVDDGRARWHERAAIGDLEALKARSRIREAEALTDPDGLGGFTVFEWQIGY